MSTQVIHTTERVNFTVLRTPPEHKRHLLFETDHSVPLAELTKLSLQWLDKYLGPVK